MEIIKVDETFAELIGQVHATAWQQAYKNIFTKVRKWSCWNREGINNAKGRL